MKGTNVFEGSPKRTWGPSVVGACVTSRVPLLEG